MSGIFRTNLILVKSARTQPLPPESSLMVFATPEDGLKVKTSLGAISPLLMGIRAGSHITIDDTDPYRPIISAQSYSLALDYDGTFGSASSTTGGDLPLSADVDGKFWICDEDNFYSAVAGETFDRGDYAVWDQTSGWERVPGMNTVIPITRQGSLLVGNSEGQPSELFVGTAEQVLTSNGTSATWATPVKPDPIPITQRGSLVVGSTLGQPSELFIGASGKFLGTDGLTASWTDLPEIPDPLPPLVEGDLIVGNSQQKPEALHIGGDGQVLTSDGTTATWKDIPPIPDPLPPLAEGDLIVGNSLGKPETLAVGTLGQLLASDGTTPSWIDLTLSFGDIEGTLGIDKGGTGEVTAEAALAALGGLENTVTINSKLVSENPQLTTDDIPEGAENFYNVQANWAATSGLAQILNKPANVVESIVAGGNISVDATDPAHPEVSAVIPAVNFSDILGICAPNQGGTGLQLSDYGQSGQVLAVNPTRTGIVFRDYVSGALKFKGTFGSASSTTGGDLPVAEQVNTFYICDTDDYVSAVSGITFNLNDWALWDGTSWVKVPNNDSVSSVFGRLGAIVAAYGDYSFSLITGTATVAQGGTGASTASDARTNLGALADTVKVNGKLVSTSPTLTTDDVSQGTTNLYNVNADWSSVSGPSEILNKPANLLVDITAGSNISISRTNPANPTISASGLVPDTRTVNSKPLSSDVTLTTDDVSEGSANFYNVQSDWTATGGLAQILNKPANMVQSVVAGSNITVDSSDPTAPVVSATVPESSGHTIQKASVSFPQRKNLNFIGANVTIADSSASDATEVTITQSPYTLLPATETTLGGVKIGQWVDVIADGTISVPEITTINATLAVLDQRTRPLVGVTYYMKSGGAMNLVEPTSATGTVLQVSGITATEKLGWAFTYTLPSVGVAYANYAYNLSFFYENLETSNRNYIFRYELKAGNTVIFNLTRPAFRPNLTTFNEAFTVISQLTADLNIPAGTIITLSIYVRVQTGTSAADLHVDAINFMSRMARNEQASSILATNVLTFVRGTSESQENLNAYFLGFLSAATSTKIGLVKPDNVTTFVAPDGTLSAVGGGGGGTDLSKYASDVVMELSVPISSMVSDNIFTIKASTSVVVPSGIGNYATETLASDVEINFTAANFNLLSGRIFVMLVGETPEVWYQDACFSGVAAPTSSLESMLWLDTGNNVFRATNDSGATWNVVTGMSLPICVMGVQNGVITELPKIFQTIGFFGSLAFVNAGLMVLCPNGRFPNGTYMNTTVRTTNTLTLSRTVISLKQQALIIDSSQQLKFIDYYVQSDVPPATTNTLWTRTWDNRQFLDGVPISAALLAPTVTSLPPIDDTRINNLYPQTLMSVGTKITFKYWA